MPMQRTAPERKLRIPKTTKPEEKAESQVDTSGETPGAAARAMHARANVPGFSRVVLEGLVSFAEFLLITIIGFAVHFIYIARVQGYAQPYLIGVPCVAAAAVLALQSADLYRISALRSFPAEGLRLVGALTSVFAGALVLIFFLKLDAVFSRVFMLTWYGGSLVGLSVERAGVALLVSRLIHSGRLARRNRDRRWRRGGRCVAQSTGGATEI